MGLVNNQSFDFFRESRALEEALKIPVGELLRGNHKYALEGVYEGCTFVRMPLVCFDVEILAELEQLSFECAEWDHEYCEARFCSRIHQSGQQSDQSLSRANGHCQKDIFFALDSESGGEGLFCRLEGRLGRGACEVDGEVLLGLGGGLSEAGGDGVGKGGVGDVVWAVPVRTRSGFGRHA